MSDNHFFAEQELCNSRMNDRVVEKRRRLAEPKHWRQAPLARQERLVSHRGVLSRVQLEIARDPTEPSVENSELLVGLSTEERRALFAGAEQPDKPDGSLSDARVMDHTKSPEVADGVNNPDNDAERSGRHIFQVRRISSSEGGRRGRSAFTSRHHRLGKEVRKARHLELSQQVLPPLPEGSNVKRRGLEATRLSFAISDDANDELDDGSVGVAQ